MVGRRHKAPGDSDYPVEVLEVGGNDVSVHRSKIGQGSTHDSDDRKNGGFQRSHKLESVLDVMRDRRDVDNNGYQQKRVSTRPGRAPRPESNYMDDRDDFVSGYEREQHSMEDVARERIGEAIKGQIHGEFNPKTTGRMTNEAESPENQGRRSPPEREAKRERIVMDMVNRSKRARENHEKSSTKEYDAPVESEIRGLIARTRENRAQERSRSAPVPKRAGRNREHTSSSPMRRRRLGSESSWGRDQSRSRKRRSESEKPRRSRDRRNKRTKDASDSSFPSDSGSSTSSGFSSRSSYDMSTTDTSHGRDHGRRRRGKKIPSPRLGRNRASRGRQGARPSMKGASGTRQETFDWDAIFDVAASIIPDRFLDAEHKSFVQGEKKIDPSESGYFTKIASQVGKLVLGPMVEKNDTSTDDIGNLRGEKKIKEKVEKISNDTQPSIRDSINGKDHLVATPKSSNAERKSESPISDEISPKDDIGDLRLKSEEPSKLANGGLAADVPKGQAVLDNLSDGRDKKENQSKDGVNKKPQDLETGCGTNMILCGGSVNSKNQDTSRKSRENDDSGPTAGSSLRKSDSDDAESTEMNDDAGFCFILNILPGTSNEGRVDSRMSSRRDSSKKKPKSRDGTEKKSQHASSRNSKNGSRESFMMVDSKEREMGHLGDRRSIPMEITTMEKPKTKFLQDDCKTQNRKGGSRKSEVTARDQKGQKQDSKVEVIADGGNKTVNPQGASTREISSCSSGAHKNTLILAISSDSEDRQKATAKSPVVSQNVQSSTQDDQSSNSLVYSLATADFNERPPALQRPSSRSSNDLPKVVGEKKPGDGQQLGDFEPKSGLEREKKKDRDTNDLGITSPGDDDGISSLFKSSGEKLLSSRSGQEKPSQSAARVEERCGKDSPNAEKGDQLKQLNPSSDATGTTIEATNSKVEATVSLPTNESKLVAAKVKDGIAQMVAKFEKLGRPKSLGPIKRAPPMEENYVQDSDRKTVASSAIENLAVALSLSSESNDNSRVVTQGLAEKDTPNEKIYQKDPQTDLQQTSEKKIENTPPFTTHKKELLAKILAFQDRKASKNGSISRTPSPFQTSTTRGRQSPQSTNGRVTPVSATALTVNAHVQGRKVAQSYIESLSKKQSHSAQSYIEAVSKKQSKAGRTLVQGIDGEARAPTTSAIKAFLKKKEDVASERQSPAASLIYQFDRNLKANNRIGTQVASPKKQVASEVRPVSAPRTRAETAAVENRTPLTPDSAVGRLHAALFDDATTSTGLLSETKTSLHVSSSIDTFDLLHPKRTLSRAKDPPSFMDGENKIPQPASSDQLRRSSSTPDLTPTVSRNSKSGNLLQMLVTKNTSADGTLLDSERHQTTGLVDSGNMGSRNYESGVKQETSSHPNGSSVGLSTSSMGQIRSEHGFINVSDLVSKIDHVVHRLIKTGKLDFGNDGDPGDLHKLTLRKNTAELLENLAILRSRRSDSPSISKVVNISKEGEEPGISIREESKDIEAAIHSLEYQKVLQSRREIRARRDEAARLVLQGTSSAHPQERTSPSQGMQSHQANAAPSHEQEMTRAVGSSRHSSESGNFTQLRLRRDQAARMIQQQAQKLVTLSSSNGQAQQSHSNHQYLGEYRQQNNGSPFQTKPNHGHQRLPQKPRTPGLLRQGEQPAAVLKTALKPARFSNDETTRQRSSGLDNQNMPSSGMHADSGRSYSLYESSGTAVSREHQSQPHRLPSDGNLRHEINEERRRACPPKPEAFDPPGVELKQRRKGANRFASSSASTNSSASFDSTLESSARDTRDGPERNLSEGTGYRPFHNSHMPAYNHNSVKNIPRRQSDSQSQMSGWEQAELQKLPILLSSATSNSNHLEMSDDDSYDDSSVSSDDSDDDTERLERIETMIHQLRERRSRPAVE